MRPSRPVIVRSKRNPASILVGVVIMALLAWMFLAPSAPKNEGPSLESQFSIRELKVEFEPGGGHITWKISGTLINMTRQTLPSPGVRIDLNDDTGRAVKSVDVNLDHAPLTGQGSVRFVGRLQSEPGARYTPVANLIKGTP